MSYDIVCVSHLRWSGVFQRPQQLLSRLARSHRVFFIEEPEYEDTANPRWEAVPSATENVFVFRPRMRATFPFYVGEQVDVLRTLMIELMASEAIYRPVIWLYTPMALPIVEHCPAVARVFDCMDELSAFRFAPAELVERDRATLHWADVVFTGGRSLYEARRHRHGNIHCFPSSVDAAHFGAALAESTPEPEVQRILPRPRLGYFGVIDERMDYELIAALAHSHPEWNLVMVGPFAKVDPQEVPRFANLHYVGQQPYASLPGYVKGWDVALMPFAQNEATRFLSPTKVLEYMAAERPVVSTPLPDLLPYQEAILLAEDAPAFISACEQALSVSAARRAEWTAKMREVVAATSWDETVHGMKTLIERIVTRSSALPLASPPRQSQHESHMHVRNIILGGGPAGLSAAYHLQDEYLLLEKEDRIGGLCKSIEDTGFVFDQAGHIVFTTDPYVQQTLYPMLLGDNLHWQHREAWIYSKEVYTRYPFQAATFGLPIEVVKECILGAIAAREERGGEATNFYEFIMRNWGAGIAKHFMLPYNEKLWAVPLQEMSHTWLSGRVPLPDLAEILDGALRPQPKPMGPNALFGYPLHGGFEALVTGWKRHLDPHRMRVNVSIDAIDPARKIVTLSTGAQLEYENLIVTAPLPVVVGLLTQAPSEVRLAAQHLRSVSVRCVNIGIDRPDLTEKHWIYYPEDTVFHRIFVQSNASPFCAPAGCSSFTAEISYSPYKPLPCDGSALTELVIADAQRVGMLRPDDRILVANQIDLPFAYVIPDVVKDKSIATIRSWLTSRDIHLAGRFAEWAYYNSDHAMLAGKRVADLLRQEQSTHAVTITTPAADLSIRPLSAGSVQPGVEHRDQRGHALTLLRK
jgi:UDP-galactopyranose mutase